MNISIGLHSVDESTHVITNNGELPLCTRTSYLRMAVLIFWRATVCYCVTRQCLKSEYYSDEHGACHALCVEEEVVTAQEKGNWSWVKSRIVTGLAGEAWHLSKFPSAVGTRPIALRLRCEPTWISLCLLNSWKKTRRRNVSKESSRATVMSNSDCSWLELTSTFPWAAGTPTELFHVHENSDSESLIHFFKFLIQTLVFYWWQDGWSWINYLHEDETEWWWNRTADQVTRSSVVKTHSAATQAMRVTNSWRHKDKHEIEGAACCVGKLFICSAFGTQGFNDRSCL